MTVASELRFVTSTDGDLAYLDTGGTGEPLVLLHSGYADHRVFEDQIRAFAPAYRVIAPDTRGHGWSANASRPFRWADDLAGLLRHLDIGPAVLVGVCMGSAVATDTALEYPHLVRALVVNGAGTSEFEYTDPWTLQRLAKGVGLLSAGDIAGYLEGFKHNVAGPHRAGDEADPDVVRRLREMVAHTLAKHTLGEPERKEPLTGTWERLAKIDVPVLAIHGALDATDAIAMAQRVADSAPHGRSVTIEGTGHYPNMEKPDAFNEALADFLRTL
ncbi:alpha/beta fold hydrolase [Streptomyces sp. V3I7]|uniref:alpha/beta fold hydrolase n=1 Tax=Streptomyces sp. V3I7 TaxID=3042278 RepID=UPI00277D3BF3|nr:alpha/beta hydrolase [Streptomyces sp. V3I7]MDQ0994304.1 pimeloyl-ACP methyl ester carboxylesterase [Streptomyces sp. V3I7]